MHMAAKTAVVALAIFSVTPAGAAWTDDDLTPVEPVRQRDDSAAGLEQLTSAPQLEVQHHSFVGPDGEPITGEVSLFRDTPAATAATTLSAASPPRPAHPPRCMRWIDMGAGRSHTAVSRLSPAPGVS